MVVVIGKFAEKCNLGTVDFGPLKQLELPAWGTVVAGSFPSVAGMYYCGVLGIWTYLTSFVLFFCTALSVYVYVPFAPLTVLFIYLRFLELF